MTRLRKMMLEELQRRNFSEHTIRYYIRTVEDFARHFNRPPDRLGLQHIREYQAELFQKQKLSAGTVNPDRTRLLGCSCQVSQFACLSDCGEGLQFLAHVPFLSVPIGGQQIYESLPEGHYLRSSGTGPIIRATADTKSAHSERSRRSCLRPAGVNR